jgi:dihydroflavonol-4-reductase
VLALVTGASGFIGANICRALLRRGHQVRALVRRGSDLSSLNGLPLELVYGDVLQLETLIPAAAGCESVFHAASVFAYWGQAEGHLEKTAVDGVSNMLVAAKATGVKRFVLTSSSIVCGSSNLAVVRTETDSRSDGEPSPEYFESKCNQEHTARERADELDVDLVVVNPCITVGAYDTKLSPSNSIVVAYLSDPFRSTFAGGCNIVSVADVAEGHVLAAEKGSRNGRYLLGSENLEWSLIHRIVAELCGVPAPRVYANHTTSYLAATASELWATWTGTKPITSRAQAKMVGRFYWYSHAKAAVELGYAPRPARQALAQAVAFLVRSPLISPELRRSLALNKEVYDAQIRLNRDPLAL